MHDTIRASVSCTFNEYRIGVGTAKNS